MTVLSPIGSSTEQQIVHNVDHDTTEMAGTTRSRQGDDTNNDSSINNHHSLPSVDTLFVWDFDWTIVNCNSDEYVPAAFLGEDVTRQRLRSMIHTYGPTKWHDCIATLINHCMEESQPHKKCTTMQDVSNAAASMPYLKDVYGSLTDVNNYVIRRHHHHSCGQAIISDGNDYFIGAFVRANCMEQYFTHGIETNFGIWKNMDANYYVNSYETDPTPSLVSGRQRPRHQFNVVHQSSKYGGHSCKICPPNLCKTQVLLDILSRIDKEQQRRRPRIVYIGDGENDACPALHVLDDNDTLLARTGRKPSRPNSNVGVQIDDRDEEIINNNTRDNNGSDFGIISSIEKHQRNSEGTISIHCHVHMWSTGKELRSHIRDLLTENQ